MRLSKTTVLLAVGCAVVWGVALGALVARNSEDATAVKATDFQPGRIIDDAVFFDKNSMTLQEIEQFIKNRTATCDTWGEKLVGSEAPAYASMKRKDYAALRLAQGNTYFHAPPYICLTNYFENPDTKKTSFETGGERFEGSMSAAEIIYAAAQAYNISPKVLLVTIKKEYGSIFTDEWPVKSQYNYIMGAGCPDSGPGFSAQCDPKNKGFYDQIMYAGWLFNNYKVNNHRYNYQPGRMNQIGYAPNVGLCGSTWVYIENMATALLYIYTPYVPNAAALAAYPGTAYCGAYGNRNFFMYYNEWFGSTYAVIWEPFTTPRWMQLKEGTQKQRLPEGDYFGDVFSAGRQARFVEKVTVNGVQYARTEWDKANGNHDGIRVDMLEEIQAESMEAKWMTIVSDSNKLSPSCGTKYESVSEKTATVFTGKIVVNGATYYRTKWEGDRGANRFISEDVLDDFKFMPFVQSRWMVVSRSTQKIDVLTGETLESVAKGSIWFFDQLVTIDGVLYAQVEIDAGTNFAIRADALDEADIGNIWEPFTTPRWMQLKEGTQKQRLPEGDYFGDVFSAGRQARFVEKVTVNGVQYARTEWDKANGNHDGIRVDMLEEIQAESMEAKWMRVTERTQKVNPINGLVFEIVTVGAQAKFVDSVTVNGELYYRTEWERGLGNMRFIRASTLTSY